MLPAESPAHSADSCDGGPGEIACWPRRFDPVALRVVRALRPDVPTALVVGSDGDLGAALREAQRARHCALHAKSELVDRSLVERARALGLALHAWTVNDADELRASRRSAWTA